MGRSTIHYTDNKTNNSLKKLHKLLRPAGAPVQRVEYIIELLLLRIFEVKLRRDGEFASDAAMQKKWKAFCRKIDTMTDDYNTVLKTIKEFLNEPFITALNGTVFSNYWSALNSRWKPIGGIIE